MTVHLEHIRADHKAIGPLEASATLALRNAINLWAAATTAVTSGRRGDLIRDKTAAVASFFAFTEHTHPDAITPEQIRLWQAHLESGKYKPATVYARISRLSSFYEWLIKDPALGFLIQNNPVRFARPKAPRLYQTEATSALDDRQLRALVAVVRKRASTGDPVGMRDYALLLFYIVTGMRRSEVINLRGSDLKMEDEVMIVRGRVKGGDYIGREVRDPSLRRALLEYLRGVGREDALTGQRALWTRHDNAGRPGAPLTSHAFARNLKIYAREAGIERIHLHQTRHTFARLVAERSGSISDTQEALGHRNQSATRIYVQRITVKRDKYGEAIGRFIDHDDSQ